MNFGKGGRPRPIIYVNAEGAGKTEQFFPPKVRTQMKIRMPNYKCFPGIWDQNP